jgi:hypothetical protein
MANHLNLESAMMTLALAFDSLDDLYTVMANIEFIVQLPELYRASGTLHLLLLFSAASWHHGQLGYSPLDRRLLICVDFSAFTCALLLKRISFDKLRFWWLLLHHKIWFKYIFASISSSEEIV